MCNNEKLSCGDAGQRENSCFCREGQGFLSKKKKIEALKKALERLQEKSDDIKEYIKEMESA